MNAKRVFVFILIVYLLGFFAHAIYLGKTVYGDGVYYYQWLTSPLTPNKFAIGPALLWLPTYSIFHNQFAVGATSVLYAVIGLILLYRLTNILTVLTIAFATNLFFYGSLDTVNSHAVSFFAASLYLSFLFAKKKNYFAIGASLGLLGLIRPQDLIYGILLIPMISFDTLIPGIRRGIVGLFIVFLPQLLAWQLTTGKFWLSPYLAAGDYFDLFHPHISELLPLSPVILGGIAGLVYWKKSLKNYWLLVIFIEAIIVATYSQGQGATVGTRMMISSYPLIAFGLARVFQWLSRHGWNEKLFFLILIGPLSAINMLMVFFFLLTH